MTEQRKNWSYEEIWSIAMAYAKSMETEPQLLSAIGSISRESKLPYPKKTIKHALATLLLIEQNNDALILLGEAYAYLHTFVSDEVYQFVTHRRLGIQSSKTPPSKDDIDDMSQSLINLSEEEHKLWMSIQSEKNAEYKRLSHELKILLEIIGDPNDFAKYLEQMGD